MVSFAIISSIACVSYIYLGILTLLFDASSKVNKSFTFLCTSFALWSFGTAGQNLVLGSQTAVLFDKITYTGAELYALCACFFFLQLTGYINKKTVKLFIISAVCCVVVLQTVNWGWNYIALQFPSGFFYVSHHVIVNLINVTGLALVFIWGNKSSFRREKLQSRLIVLSTLIGIVLSFGIDFTLGSMGYPSLTSSLPLLWMGFISFGIIHYGLMRLSPAQVGRELISGIEEAVFILDNEWKICDINNAALLMTGRHEKTDKVLCIDDIFIRSENLKKQLSTMIQTKNNVFSQNEIIKVVKGNSLLVHSDFHIILDHWGDRFGILCICRSLQDLKSFISRYGFSRRETEILHHIVAGCTQTDTAESLRISVATVKTHTTGLYNKLGISSRNELFSILRGEGLDPNLVHDTSL